MAAGLSNRYIKRGSRLVLLMFLVTSFNGCASIPVDRQILTLNPEGVVQRLERSGHTILQAIAKIEAKNTEGRYATKAAVLIKKPSSLRIEAIPVFGPVNLFLSVHNDILKIFLPQRGTFYIGKAISENLAHIVKYFPPGLSIEELLPIMLGTYPSLHEENVSLRGSWEEKQYRVDMTAKDGRKLQSIWIDISTQNLIKVQVFNKADSVLYTASFEEFKELPSGVAMPFKITITLEKDGYSELSIHYSSVQFVSDIAAQMFDLQIPPGIEPIHLD